MNLMTGPNFNKMDLSEELFDKLFTEGGFKYPVQAIWFKTKKTIYKSANGFVATEDHGKFHVVCGDPLAINGKSSRKILQDFISWAHQNHRKVCGYYFSKEVSAQSNCRRYLAGVSRGTDLEALRMSGFSSRDIRRAFNQAKKSNLEFYEISHEQKKSWFYCLKEKEQRWLSQKMGPRIHFILSELKTDYIGSENERWFVVIKEGFVQAFATVIYPPGGNLGYIDQMVQVPRGHRFALDFLLSQILFLYKALGMKMLWLGLCVFIGVRPASFLESLFVVMRGQGWFYPSKNLYRYKRKFTNLEPERYLLLDRSAGFWQQVMVLSRATYPQMFKRSK